MSFLPTLYIQLNPHLHLLMFTVDSVSNNTDLMPYAEFMAVLVDAGQKSPLLPPLLQPQLSHTCLSLQSINRECSFSAWPM